MSMEDRDGFIWLDGVFVPWRDARIHILSHTLHHGLGIFEGIRAYRANGGTAIFRLRDHTKRFFQSAHILQMSLPVAPDEIDAATIAVVKKNEHSECYIRPLAYYGGDEVGVSAANNRVHVSIVAWPWNKRPESDEAAIRVKTSSFSRHHVNSTTIHAKACGHYINSMLANREAVSAGYDEALMLDTNGLASEGSTHNLFIVRNGRLLTPTTANVLNGITRDTVLEIAKERGIACIETTITRDEVYCADEAFFTGTAAEIVPIKSLDDRTIGDAKVGPITRQLRADYFATIHGELLLDRDWLRYVS